MSNLSQFSGTRLPSAGGLNSALILFEAKPGTRSWTCPAGVGKIRVFTVGGGADGTTSAGGGGGGYAEKTITVTPGTSYTYVVGAAGGTSSFSTVCSATGGSGATGGQGISGDLLAIGGNGGSTVNSGGGAAGGPLGDGGAGGNGAAYIGGGGGGLGGGIGANAVATCGVGGNGQGSIWRTGIVCSGKGGDVGAGAAIGSTAWAMGVAFNPSGAPGCGGAGSSLWPSSNNVSNQFPAGNGGIGGGGGGASTNMYAYWNGSSTTYQYTSGNGGHGGIGGGGGGTSTSTAGNGGTTQPNGIPGKGGTGCVGIEVIYF